MHQEEPHACTQNNLALHTYEVVNPTFRKIAALVSSALRTLRLGPGRNGDKMQPLIWMSLGAAIGWTSGRALQDGGYDWFRDVVMGIGGVVVGGLLGISDGFGGYRGTVVTTTMATVAVMLLAVLVSRSRAHPFAHGLNAPKLRFAWSSR